MTGNEAPRLRWLWTARGLAAVVLAGATLARGPVSLDVTAEFLGKYWAVDAALALLLALGPRPWWPMALVGVLEAGLAFFVLVAPGAAATALLWPAVPVVWALVSGVLHLAAAPRTRPIGLLHVLLGLVLVWFPAPGVALVAQTIVGFVAASAVVMLALAAGLAGAGEHVSPVLRWVTASGAAAIAGALTGLLVLPLGLILDERLTWLLVLLVTAVFGALAAVWTTRARLGTVLAINLVAAVVLWLVRLGGGLERLLETNIASLGVYAAALAVVAASATATAEPTERDAGRLGRATLALVVVSIVGVPLVVVLASFFGLVGA